MDINYFLSIVRPYLKPIFKEALQEILAENQLSITSNPKDVDRVVGATEAAKLLGYKDRHAAYAAIKNGLKYVGEKPFRFRVSDIRDFLETQSKTTIIK